MLRKIVSSFVFCLLFSSFISPVTAAGDFYTSLSTTYTVGTDGITHVTHDFKITNNTPTTFIKQYALKTTFTNIRNIMVKSNGATIPANVVTTDAGTNIAIDFSDQVVGQGKSRNFSIEYDNADLATIGGSVLEVHIPKLAGATVFDEVYAHVVTPLRYGAPVRHNPAPTEVNHQNNSIMSSFSNLQGESISLLFGQEQIYNLTLRYHLENAGSEPALAQVALPPDTSFQRMFYHSLEPLPQEIKKDIDGNWIATYKVPANSTTTVHLIANALLTLQENTEIPVVSPSTNHLENQTYWEVDNAQIQDLAQKYSTPESIYNFVTTKLMYSRELIGQQQVRLGAVAALEKPAAAVCQEFTDTFIAIARAAEIPARRLTGFAYTQNETLRPLSLEGDILHAWPEYYDATQSVWKPIDPTWGNTTNGIDYFHQFDLNHIVFAINGVSSTTPFAAGFYKTERFNTKDVEVTFGNSFPEVIPDLSVNLEPIRIMGIPVPGFYNISLINKSGQALYNLSVNTASDNNLVEAKPFLSRYIETLLPFQTSKMKTIYYTSEWRSPKTHLVTVTITSSNNQTYASTQTNITTGPKIIYQIDFTFFLIGVGICLAVTTLTTGSVLVFRRKKQRALRRQSQKS